MNTPLRRFVTDLNQMLQQAVVNQGVQLAKGSCPNFEQYQRKVGRCEGLEQAGALALDMLRKIEMGDDDSGGLPSMPDAGNPGEPPPQQRRRRGKA